MADRAKTAVCVVSSILLCGAAHGIVNESANPYQGIVDRNVFGLKPPPPAKEAEVKHSDLPPITLTGLTTILSSKRALLNVQVPGKPVQSYIIPVGQRDGDIEVLEIDEKAGSVKVNQAGTIVTLNFEKNGPKLIAAAPATGAPGSPGVPTPLTYAAPGTGPAPGGLRAIPTRTPEVANQGSGLNGGNLNQGNIAQSARPPVGIDPDTQAMQMLAQHVQNTDKGIEMPPLPPPLADALGENSSSPAIPQPGGTPNRGPFLPRAPGLPAIPQ